MYVFNFKASMKNLLAAELEFNSNLEVSSQLLHNLKSIFMKPLITLDLKNTHAKFPDSFLRAFLYNRVPRRRWNGKLVSALCTVKWRTEKEGGEQKA